MEGELEKKINEKAFGWYKGKVEIKEEDLREIIDEMFKEFPKMQYNNDAGFDIYDPDEIDDWKKKWRGKNEVTLV